MEEFECVSINILFFFVVFVLFYVFIWIVISLVSQREEKKLEELEEAWRRDHCVRVVTERKLRINKLYGKDAETQNHLRLLKSREEEKK